MDTKTLSDTLHKCLVCYSPAFEYEENCYRCSDSECDFEWRVDHCE